MPGWPAQRRCADARRSGRLLAHTREAKELNRINGMLINRQMGHTQGALQTLRAAPVYGPSDHTSSGPGRRFSHHPPKSGTTDPNCAVIGVCPRSVRH
jgi:flagella synthesis protein FlgN